MYGLWLQLFESFGRGAIHRIGIVSANIERNGIILQPARLSRAVLSKSHPVFPYEGVRYLHNDETCRPVYFTKNTEFLSQTSTLDSDTSLCRLPSPKCLSHRTPRDDR